MSRIAKYPIALPKGVEVNVASGQISVKGPLGTIARAADPNVEVAKDGDRIVCKHSFAQIPRSTVEWAIALHCDNTICNHEVNRYRCANIEDALLNPCPMEDVFGPSVSRPWHNTEHVLHA